ncbi:hypothetical protein K503DRAFT_778129 [Rhizopogon vinicolor AM-OR11-026]|uniref:Uncharacterized protein n=1 Tax=Rhizopogon vinicolor AM-OR11-026 TaxID=1314800 RepID=A0A1B7MD88_9AGAM|nr:hypothetical protein K503DRAFT_778129 [Rhizopogon vinicolor AM-OR11-026]
MVVHNVTHLLRLSLQLSYPLATVSITPLPPPPPPPPSSPSSLQMDVEGDE